MKTISYITLPLLILLILVNACGHKENHKEPAGHSHNTKDNNVAKDEHSEHEEMMLSAQQFEDLKMKIGTISSRQMSGYVEANGTLEVPPQSEAAITSVVGANVVSIAIMEGDKVEKGQVVAYISHPNIIKMQTDYLNAYRDSHFLNKTYKRQQKLYDAGVGSGANFQKAETEYEASKARANGMAAQLQLLNINTAAVRAGAIAQNVALRSPIEGFVQQVEVKTGQFVEPQTELFEIVNPQNVHVELMVFEKDAYKVQKGQKASFKTQSNQDMEWSAEIYSVGKSFKDNPKSISVLAAIKNKNSTLIPGMYIQGRIQIEQSEIMALPESAIIKEGDRFFVFSVEKENDNWSFRPIEVFLGQKDGYWVAVKFPKPVAPETKFAYNNAYYLGAEMKKGDTEHAH